MPGALLFFGTLIGPAKPSLPVKVMVSKEISIAVPEASAIVNCRSLSVPRRTVMFCSVGSAKIHLFGDAVVASAAIYKLGEATDPCVMKCHGHAGLSPQNIRLLESLSLIIVTITTIRLKGGDVHHLLFMALLAMSLVELSP